MKRVVRSWLAQQQHKRDCRYGDWWRLEVWNCLLDMYIGILDKEN